MTARPLSPSQFSEITHPLIGQTISRTWCGYGLAIFFEIGPLRQYETKRRNGKTRVRDVGEVTLMIEWSWRVEKVRSIAFGSWNSKRQIESGIQKLRGSIIESIELEGRIPEIVFGLSGGRWVHSFMTVESQPAWALLWNDTSSVDPRTLEKSIGCERGRVVLKDFN